jgi:hypothetical protein
MTKRNTRRCAALVAVAALLVAAPVLAGDRDRDHSRCDTGCGWTVEASQPAFCGPNQQNTCINYTLSGGQGIPDHLGVYLPVELEVVSTAPGAKLVDLCGNGESAIKVLANCHERLLLFNVGKGPFWLQVKGRHQKALTTVVVKKGYAQCASLIDGIGSVEVPEETACVNSCGNLNAHQQRKSVETFKFKGCQMSFTYGSDGSVQGFDACTLDESGSYCIEGPSDVCRIKTGNIGELDLIGGITEGNTEGAFGDGWINTGQNSCATRLVAGRYYTVCY